MPQESRTELESSIDLRHILWLILPAALPAFCDVLILRLWRFRLALALSFACDLIQALEAGADNFKKKTRKKMRVFDY